jgi:O-methyltransferase
MRHINITNDQLRPGELDVILRELERSLSAMGDIVELGCYKGDTSIEIARISSELTRPGACNAKRLWLYDSFDGLPEKTVHDNSAMSQAFAAGELAASKGELINRFKKLGLPMPKIKKAWFSDLTDHDLPSQICFAFLDGDYYESIRDSLFLVQNKMTNGSKIIVHDYSSPALPGVARAVDEWLTRNPHKIRVEKTMAIIEFAS